MQKIKKKRGDRKDATLVRNLDALHTFMPFLIPNRVDNEAVMNDDILADNAVRYIEEKNAANPEFKYTMFHFVIAALAKTIYMRPYMNRFIQGHRLYQRDDISFTFVIKKKFEDHSEESLAMMSIDPDSPVSPIEQVHAYIEKKVNYVRKEGNTDGTTDKIEKLNKLPRWIMRIVANVLFKMDYYGKLPEALRKDDPYNTTCFLTNLGSIKMDASYHHLANWGTNSFFLVVGTMKKKPIFNDDGTFEMKTVLPLGMTIDERIADGFYFAKSIKLLRKIFEDPSILDKPFDTEFVFEEK